METRILMLYQAGIIDETIKEYLSNVVNKLNQEGFDKESDDMSRMITHFAMALSRQQRGEIVGSIEPFIYDEVQNNTNFKDALHIWNSLQNGIPLLFSEDETKFMMLHLVNLVENK